MHAPRQKHQEAFSGSSTDSAMPRMTSTTSASPLAETTWEERSPFCWRNFSPNSCGLFWVWSQEDYLLRDTTPCSRAFSGRPPSRSSPCQRPCNGSGNCGVSFWCAANRCQAAPQAFKSMSLDKPPQHRPSSLQPATLSSSFEVGSVNANCDPWLSNSLALPFLLRSP